MQRRVANALLTLCGAVMSVAMASATAANVNVDCGKSGANARIESVLGRLKPGENNVVQVSGTCRENLKIQGFDGLTLIGAPGAVIEDASNGSLAVIDIRGSHRISLEGFSIRGGSSGVTCQEFSSCTLKTMNVEDTQLYPGYNAGILAAESDIRLQDVLVRNVYDAGVALYGARADVYNVTVDSPKNGGKWPFGAGVALFVGTLKNGPITIQRAAGTGVLAGSGAVIDLNGLTATDGDGDGVWVGGNSLFNVYGPAVIERNLGTGLYIQMSQLGLGQGTISGNGGWGIWLHWASKLTLFGPMTVTNHSQGLVAGEGSLAVVGGGANLSGNYYADIWCLGPPYGNVLGLENVTYGTIDCPVAPATAKSHPMPKMPMQRQ